VFLIDRSGSIGDYNFELMRSFIKNIVNNFAVGPDGVHVAAIGFESYGEVLFRLTQHSSNAEVQAALDAIVYTSGGTDFHCGLELVLSDIFAAGNGARSDASHVVVFLTDGQDGGYQAPLDSDAIRAAGIKILAVGIGYGVYEDALVRIAGSQENYFDASSFDDLGNTFAESISSASC
jgi:hypothetical protein